GPGHALVLARRAHLHPVLLPRGLRLRRRHAAPVAGPQRGRGEGPDRHHRPVLGRQRGVGHPGRGRDVLDVPHLVRRGVQRAVPGVHRHPPGAAAARGLLRVPQPGRPPALAQLLGLDVLLRQRPPRVPVGRGDGQAHRGPAGERRRQGRGRPGRHLHALRPGRGRRDDAAVRAARRQLPAAAPAHRLGALHPGTARGPALGRPGHRGDPGLRDHGLRHRGAVRELRGAALGVPGGRVPHPGQHLAGPVDQARHPGVHDERADHRLRDRDGVHRPVHPRRGAALHPRRREQPHPGGLGQPGVHPGADDLGRRHLPAADHRLPGVELPRLPRARPPRRGRPRPRLL
ncbi:MAG: Cytochrome bd terminal oxidase subunit II, partial [uncultured Quadrisphaera sp.]